MKYSGVKWIGDIPDDWEVVRFKDKYINKKDIVGDKSEDYERLALTLNGVIKREKNDSDGLQPKEFNGYQIIYENDFIFKMIDLQNISTSRVGLSPYTGLVSPAYIRFSPRTQGQYSKYVYYFLMSLYYNCVYNSLGGNGVRSALNATDMGLFKIPYPSLSTQQKIAEYLDYKCGQVDGLIANQQAQIEKLKQYKQSVITEAVTHGLNPSALLKDSGIDWIGSIPENWELLRAKWLFTQRNEKGNKIELQLLSPTQNYGVIPQELYEELSGMSAVKLKESVDLSSLKTIHKGDYCISLRSFQGGFEYSVYEGVVSPAYQVFYAIADVSEGYYKYLFKEISFIKEMNSHTLTIRDGKNIAFADFANTEIPIPPLEEQQQIADYLDNKCGEIDRLISLKQQKIDALTSYKKSLIYEYVTGKKEVI